jgi:hypothetical protein
VALEGRVNAVVKWGNGLVAATEENIYLLDNKLEIIGEHPGAVVSLAVLPGIGSSPVLAAATLRGEIVYYQITNGNDKPDESE